MTRLAELLVVWTNPYNTIDNYEEKYQLSRAALPLPQPIANEQYFTYRY